MAKDRVPFDRLPDRDPVRAWESGEQGSWLFRRIEYGRYGTRGWYVRREGRRWDGCWTVGDEREACDVIDHWMLKATGWVEIPVRDRAVSGPAW